MTGRRARGSIRSRRRCVDLLEFSAFVVTTNSQCELVSLQVITLREAMNVQPLTGGQPRVGAPQTPEVAPPQGQSQAMPTGYQMTTPMNEAELTALLMASPLYQKMEQIKQVVAKGAINKGGRKSPQGTINSSLESPF